MPASLAVLSASSALLHACMCCALKLQVWRRQVEGSILWVKAPNETGASAAGAFFLSWDYIPAYFKHFFTCMLRGQTCTVSAGVTLRSGQRQSQQYFSANTATLLQVRLDMAHHLILAYELHKDMDVYVRSPVALPVASYPCTVNMCQHHAPAASGSSQREQWESTGDTKTAGKVVISAGPARHPVTPSCRLYCS